MNEFQRALQVTLQFEGGISNNPNDPGKFTNRGVTQAVYRAYRLHHNLPVQSVANMSQAELEAIYKFDYWDRIVTTEQWPLNAVLFDIAVNSGVGRAQQLYAQALPKVPKSDPKYALNLALTLCTARAAFFQGLAASNPRLNVFLKGWLNRNAILRSICLK